MSDTTLDKIQSTESATPKSKRSAKGGNIVTTAAATSEIIAGDAKTDATIAANIYNKAFAAGYVAERQRGAEELQELIVKAGEATRAAIQAVDIEAVSADVLAANEADVKKSLAGIFDQYF